MYNWTTFLCRLGTNCWKHFLTFLVVAFPRRKMGGLTAMSWWVDCYSAKVRCIFAAVVDNGIHGCIVLVAGCAHAWLGLLISCVSVMAACFSGQAKKFEVVW